MLAGIVRSFLCQHAPTRAVGLYFWAILLSNPKWTTAWLLGQGFPTLPPRLSSNLLSNKRTTKSIWNTHVSAVGMREILRQRPHGVGGSSWLSGRFGTPVVQSSTLVAAVPMAVPAKAGSCNHQSCAATRKPNLDGFSEGSINILDRHAGTANSQSLVRLLLLSGTPK
jgi:hypothetical protein